jgi:transposase
MADTGRPTKRTPETEEAIFACLKEGMTKKAAAAAGGITYMTLRQWEKDFPEFSDALQNAEAAGQQALLRRIWAAAGTPDRWQAAAWILERRWPQDFARRQALEMSGPEGGPIEHRDLSALPDHERRLLRDAIVAHLRDRERSDTSA